MSKMNALLWMESLDEPKAKKNVPTGKKNISIGKTKAQIMMEDVVKLNKKFGDGRMVLSSDSRLVARSYTTGSVMLDLATGGWYPEGRMVEIYGVPSSGKTMMALHAIRERQILWDLCAFIDFERTITRDRMLDLGVDIDSLVTVYPDYAEDGIDHIEALANSWVKLIVVDSVAAMLPFQEATSDTWDTQVMIMGRIMSKAMRKLTPIISDMGVTIIWLNQTRKTITMSKDNNVTTGGGALGFYASLRIKMHRNSSEASQIKDDNKQVVGAKVSFTVTKNKVSSPFEKIDLDIDYSGYINENKDILSYIKSEWLVTKIGKEYYLSSGDKKLLIGENNLELSEMLRTRKVRTEVTSIIMEYYNNKRREQSELVRSRYF